ncbi:MAG: glycosyltransferase family 4 protein [Dehalococcoidia bacterium]
MRIAQVAPLYESVPPSLYGGTERVVHFLTEELVRQGHEVTLFASGDSVTSARLVSPRATSLRLDRADAVEATGFHALQAEMVARGAERGDFDIVHVHGDQSIWSVLRRVGVPHVTTLHGRLDLPSVTSLLRLFDDEPLVSISDSHRTPVSDANWMSTVHHGLPKRLFSQGTGDGGYLAFLGRMSPEKRPDLAIEIADRTGIPLKLAAKVDGSDIEYFDRVVKPRLDASPYAEFVGEVNDLAKNDFLGGAMAMVFPIDWPEPFGLAMIEALACGTPVLAFNRGSVPEVIRHGISGYIVDGVDEAVRAVECLPMISRSDCRRDFETRFSAERMARDYLDVYARVIGDTQGRGTDPRVRLAVA